METEAIKNELAELKRKLPLKLRGNLNLEVLQAALQEDYIRIEADGHWSWQLESKTLLAYFCGRMWCGDSVRYSIQKGKRVCVWICGKKDFPNKDLTNLFQMPNIRTSRINRNTLPLPVGYELIEKIFKKIM